MSLAAWQVGSVLLFPQALFVAIDPWSNFEVCRSIVAESLNLPVVLVKEGRELEARDAVLLEPHYFLQRRFHGRNPGKRLPCYLRRRSGLARGGSHVPWVCSPISLFEFLVTHCLIDNTQKYGLYGTPWNLHIVM